MQILSCSSVSGLPVCHHLTACEPFTPPETRIKAIAPPCTDGCCKLQYVFYFLSLLKHFLMSLETIFLKTKQIIIEIENTGTNESLNYLSRWMLEGPNILATLCYTSAKVKNPPEVRC